MARKQLATTSAAVEDKHDPYLKIEGVGKRSYRATIWVWDAGNYRGGCYQWNSYKVFLTRDRAESWGKRKLAKVKRIIDHEKYAQRITIN